MKSLRLLVPVLVISAVLVLGLAPSAKADAVYTFDWSFVGLSWSFEAPTIITTDTTITSFLSTNIAPGSFAAINGCSVITSVTIVPTAPPNGPFVTTACNGDWTAGFFDQLDHFGTFAGQGEGITLTISPSGVPEPSSLLLLAGGLAGLVGLRRKRK